MRQVLGRGALGIRWRRRWERGLGWGIHVNPWLIHVNVWQNPLQYCKVTSLQLIKINGKKMNLSMKVKEDNEKAGLKLNVKKTKIMASCPNTSWQIDEETVEMVTNYFLGLQNHCGW